MPRLKTSCAGVPPRFFFQAEDGIRDLIVTGVQTCALPISGAGIVSAKIPMIEFNDGIIQFDHGYLGTYDPSAGYYNSYYHNALGRHSGSSKIGRASCRERV